MRILIVEDNKILNDNIAKYLELEWIFSKQLFEWKDVNYELTINNYDLLILDLWLPDVDWIDICKQIRSSKKDIPILMLTARTAISDKKEWFNSWADDYLVKPFDYDELILRINALVRRSFSIKSENIKIWDIDIDLAKNIVLKSWKNLKLSSLEFDLLVYLARNTWKIISKEELLEKVWGEYDAFNMTRTVDVYIWYLRKKIDKEFIETIRGKWYRINN